MTTRGEKRRERRDRFKHAEKMIRLHQPFCPSCEVLFTADQVADKQLVRCKFCKYHFCAACAEKGHKCQTTLRSI